MRISLAIILCCLPSTLQIIVIFLARLIEPLYFYTLLPRYGSNGLTDFSEILHKRMFAACDDPYCF